MSIRIYPRDCPRNMSKNYAHRNLTTGLSANYVQKLFSATYPQIIILRAMHPGFYCPEDLSRDKFPRIISIIIFIKMMPGYFFLWGICSREIGQITCQKFHAQEKCLISLCSWHMPTGPCAVHYAHHQWRRGMCIIYTSVVYPHAAGVCRGHS